MSNYRRQMLITGVSGLLGSALAYYFKDRYEVLGWYNSHPVNIDGIEARKADISSKDSVNRAILNFKPEIIVHCAALADIDICEVNKKLAEKVNVLGTAIIAETASDNTKLIYISTDSVYDGIKGDFSETDTANPVNYYGLTKYRGELEASKRPNSLILRTNIFGWNIQDNKRSLAEWVFNELSNNRRINGFTDAIFSSIYTFRFARVLDLIIQRDLSGLYNCASGTLLSKYEFALRIADYFNLNNKLIQPSSMEGFNFKAKRGKNLSLNVKKLASALGETLPPIDESLKAFYDDFKKDLPNKIKQRVAIFQKIRYE